MQYLCPGRSCLIMNNDMIDEPPQLFSFLQKLKTRVIKKDVNPEWNEDLTLSVINPNHKIKLVK